MPILNYSTTVDAGKTVGEIQSILARAGASRIGVEYENAEPSGLMFQLHDRPYRLPANHAAIYELIRSNPKVTKRLRTEEQARRVAWRI